LPGFGAVERLDDARLALAPADVAPGATPADLREAVFRAAVQAGLTLRELATEPFSLEEIFTRITMSESEPHA
jgi:hypothetical protein